MGTLIRSELEAEVRYGLGNRSDLDSRLITFLNLSQAQIARYYTFSELQREIVGTLPSTAYIEDDKYVAVPTGLRAVVSFRLELGTPESRKLRYIPYMQWDKHIPEPQQYSRGKPTLYTMFANQFELWKIPDSTLTYRLRYIQTPTPFTSATDAVSDFNDKDDVIIAFAVAYAFDSLGESESATPWRRTGYSDLVRARAADEISPDFTIQPFPDGVPSGEYWADPFIRSMK